MIGAWKKLFWRKRGSDLHSLLRDQLGEVEPPSIEVGLVEVDAVDFLVGGVLRRRRLLVEQVQDVRLELQATSAAQLQLVLHEQVGL